MKGYSVNCIVMLYKIDQFHNLRLSYETILLSFVNRMDEEIVVDDIDENSSAETQQRDGSTTPVMPLLYIQQNKLRSTQSTNANQTLVSPSTQLTAIINPVNNQVIIRQVYNMCASYYI